MDETFGYVAPVLPRRTVHPLALRAAIAATVVVALSGALGVFVISQERAADERRAALAVRVAAAEEAAAEATARDAAAMVTDDVVEHAARAAAEDALAVALTEEHLGEAGPATLARSLPSLTFVDGPSTSPSVVSVAATDGAWAAAVMGDGTCVWIRLDETGAVWRDRGTTCTGDDALGAADADW
jgi:hypothetical protein